MRKIVFAMFTFIFGLLWAEVKVEKILETTDVREYNQWVKENKAKYPGLNFIYVNAKIEKKTKEGRRYRIYYYDEDGNEKYIEEVKGNTEVLVSPYFDAVGIYTCARHMATKAVIKNGQGETILETHGYLAFISPYLYLTVPEGDASPSNPMVRVFSGKSKSWVKELPDCWLLNGRNVAHSDNFDFSVVTIDRSSIHNSRYLILLDSTGKEQWRKTYFEDPEKIGGGVNVAIAPDASNVVASQYEKIYVYDSTGILQREYTFPSITVTQCGISDKGKILLVAMRNCLIKYDNETGQEIWRKTIIGGAPMKAILSKDGRYGLIQFHPNVIYLIDKGGDILQQWSLETDIHHPTASGGKEVIVIHPVEARLEFHDDIIFIIHELNGEIFIKIWRLKEE